MYFSDLTVTRRELSRNANGTKESELCKRLLKKISRG